MEQEPTDLQKLVPLKRALMRPYKLLPYQKVLHLMVTDSMMMLVLEHYEYTETTREVRFHRRGTLAKTWVIDAAGFWIEKREDQMLVWDDDFNPYIEVRYGRGYTPEEWAEQMEWEANTHRPGSSRSPMDNFEVAMFKADTTEKMFRHWTGHRKGLGYTTESDK
jgi:hypothetical protein